MSGARTRLSALQSAESLDRSKGRRPARADRDDAASAPTRRSARTASSRRASPPACRSGRSEPRSPPLARQRALPICPLSRRLRQSRNLRAVLVESDNLLGSRISSPPSCRPARTGPSFPRRSSGRWLPVRVIPAHVSACASAARFAACGTLQICSTAWWPSSAPRPRPDPQSAGRYRYPNWPGRYAQADVTGAAQNARGGCYPVAFQKGHWCSAANVSPEMMWLRSPERSDISRWLVYRGHAG